MDVLKKKLEPIFPKYLKDVFVPLIFISGPPLLRSAHPLNGPMYPHPDWSILPPLGSSWVAPLMTGGAKKGRLHNTRYIDEEKKRVATSHGGGGVITSSLTITLRGDKHI